MVHLFGFGVLDCAFVRVFIMLYRCIFYENKIHDYNMSCKVSTDVFFCVLFEVHMWHHNPHLSQVKTFQHTVFQLSCYSV